MLQRCSRLGRGWAALTVSALVASLLAVGAVPATAVTDTPDEESSVTVCLGEALEDREFTDVPDDHAFHESINCLAHYGITIGSGDGTTFSPDEPVKRWQMMLFLARALEPADIDLSAARAQNFSDLDNLNDEARDAIDLLVTNRIATPVSAETFEPDDNVDRTEMALLLVRLLAAAGPVVSFDSGGGVLLDANGDGSQSRPDDYFKDARDRVPVSADEAINAAYELGITTGADPTPASGEDQPGLDFFYRPRLDVTRGQMAAFIIRTLGHTSTRPRGLSAQYDGNEIRVSVRDDDFEPVADAPVDMFYVASAYAGQAFTLRGACTDVEYTDGAYPCEIDSSDLTTDDEGEVSLTVPERLVADGAATTLWIWTGREGDEVVRGADLFQLDVEPSEQAQGAATARLSSVFKGSKARFGATVTFTVQLQDAHGRDVTTGTDGRRPAEWSLTEELLQEAGAADGAPADASEVRSKNTRTLTSDSSGRAEFSISVPLTGRACTADSCTRTFKLAAGANAPAVADNPDIVKRSNGRSDGDVYYLEFSNASPVPADAVVKVTVPDGYLNVPASGAVRNTVIVTVHNEYGEALSAAKATLEPGDDSTVRGASSSVVGGDGLHRFSYEYDGLGGEVEVLTVTVDPDGNDATLNNLDPVKAYMFWAELTATTGTAAAKKTILFGDVDRDEVIVDIKDALAGAGSWPVATPSSPETVPERVEYDTNDRFDVQAAGEDAPRPVGSMEEFERALAEFLDRTSSDDSGVGACLEWSNYDPGRSRAVTEFKLWRTGCPGQ